MDSAEHRRQNPFAHCPGETIADMGTRAAAEALERSSTESGIGLVICATNSPDTLYPATACLIAKNLNLGHVPAL
jgi:3-oxoacyl-[acyl-carrier-protein] synthase III